MRALIAIVLALAGCAPHQEIELVGSSEHGVDIYDPNNDTWYSFSTDTWYVIKRPGWNK